MIGQQLRNPLPAIAPSVITHFKNMNRPILLILSFFICFEIFGQNNDGVKKTVTMSGSDTLELKQYNENGNLVFDKIFPQFGVSMILAYSYSDNKIISFTWSHSNIGFIESEYVYDSLKNIINIYSYESKDETGIINLMSYYSTESLKNSNEFKQYKNVQKRYLKSKQYLKDSLIVKEEEFNADSSLGNTIYNTYENGNLTRRKEVYGHNNAYNELIYVYDKFGNELQWMKVFNSSDTSVVYNSIYKDNLLTEKTGLESGNLTSKEYYEYSKGKLISVKQYDENGILKIVSKFHYNQNGKIDYVDEVNNYMGQISISTYYYE